MLKDIEALHTSRLSSPDLAKDKHRQGTDWHHQLWLLAGTADSISGTGSLQFPPTAVPRAEVIKDFKGKDALFTVASPGQSPLDINDTSQQAIAGSNPKPAGFKQQVRQRVVTGNSPPNDIAH